MDIVEAFPSVSITGAKAVIQAPSFVSQGNKLINPAIFSFAVAAEQAARLQVALLDDGARVSPLQGADGMVERHNFRCSGTMLFQQLLLRFAAEVIISEIDLQLLEFFVYPQLPGASDVILQDKARQFYCPDVKEPMEMVGHQAVSNEVSEGEEVRPHLPEEIDVIGIREEDFALVVALIVDVEIIARVEFHVIWVLVDR